MQPVDLHPPPDGWSLSRIDAIASPVRSLVDPASVGAQEVFHISIPSLDQRGDGQAEPAGEIGSQKLQLNGGEVLISRLNPRKARVHVVDSKDLPILASGEFVALKPKETCDPRFLAWLLRSETVRQALDSQVRSVTRSHQRVDPRAITQAKVWIPHLHEQLRIADFLDATEQQVAKTRDHWQELAELITERLEAVAERLIADPPRAPTRLKFVCRVQQGWSPAAGPTQAGPQDVGMLKLSAVSGARFRPEENRTVPEEILETTRWEQWQLQEGDILLTRASGSKRLVGRVCRVRGLNSRRLVFPDLMYRLSPTSVGLDSSFLGVALQAGSLRALLLERTRGAANNKVRIEDVRELPVPLPQPDEQRRIVNEFSIAQVRTDSVLREVDRHLDLLAERRDAVVTAAVTGQLEPSSCGESTETS